MVKKLCIYTCITGNYDEINELSFKENEFDYLLFTNNKKVKSKTWEVIYIENDGLDNIRLARKIKILGHDILKKYDITVWIDGASYIRNSIINFIKKYCDMSKYCLIGFKHQERDCIYDEAKACVIYGKETKEIVLNQVNFLKKNKYPERNGLIESAILVRNNRCPDLDKAMSLWFNIVKKYSCRDQLSFNYAVYKKRIKYNLLDMYAFDNEFFGRNAHSINLKNRLKEYRLYLGDDSDYSKYNYDSDYRGVYTVKNNTFIIKIKTSTYGNKIKLVIDNFGGFKISNIVVNGNLIDSLTYLNNIIYNGKNNVFLGVFPTIIIDYDYNQYEKLEIKLDIELLSEIEYFNIIDSLYVELNKDNKTINYLNNKNKKLCYEKKILNEKYDELLKSKVTQQNIIINFLKKIFIRMDDK